MNHTASKNLNLTLKIWRQDGPKNAGSLKTYQVSGISTDMSFLEMLDVLNEQLIAKGEQPVAFDHDCREGICGTCGVVITANHTDRIPAQRPASFTCAVSRMAIPL